jgi:O-antigen/teichoic acid export membrane protein
MEKYRLQIQTLLLSIKDKGFFHLFSANFFINFVGFGSQFMVAWLLTPIQLGEIKIMQTYIAVAALFTTFGFNTSTLKLCSENRQDGEKVFLFNKALKYVAICLCIIFPLLILLIKFGFISNDLEIIKYFPYFSLSLIPLTFSGIFSNYLQALKQFKSLSEIQMLTKIVSVLAVIALTYFLGFNGYIIALIFGYTLTTFFFMKRASQLNNITPEITILNPLSTHLKYANISFITNLVTQVGMFSDVFLMNYFITDKNAIGYYSFALTILIVANIFTTTVQQISVPHLSEKASNKKEFEKIAKKYGNINVIVSIVVALGLILFIPFVVKLVFGGKYDQSIPFFIILTGAWLFQNIVSFEGYSLLGAGKIGYNLLTYIIILFLGFIFSYLLMIKFGIVGLAYGKLLNGFISIFVVKIIFKKAMSTYN